MQKSLNSITCYMVQYIHRFSLECVDFVIVKLLIICTFN